MTFDEVVAAVGSEGGFDVSTAMQGGWVNEVHQKAVGAAQWMMRSLELGPTVAGTATYALPDDVVDLAGLYLQPPGATPLPYERASTAMLWSLKTGMSWTTGPGGVFVPSFDADAAALIELWPVPATSGAAINALAAMIPPLMVSGSSPVIPADMHGDLKDGAIALGLLRIEERPDSAALFDARFQAMVGNLRKRRKSRVGSGTARMRVRGHDW